MKYAYIESNKVVEVTRVNPLGIFYEGYASKFVQVPDDVEPGWTFDGTSFHAPEPVTLVPASVTRAQGKAALIGAGLWPGVQVYVAGIADPTQQALADVALNDTLEWRRDSPFLAAAAAGLGLTPEQLDGLFIAAAQIVL